MWHPPRSQGCSTRWPHSRLAFPTRFEDRLDVHNRCPVDSFEAVYAHAQVVDAENRNHVDAKRVRPMLRTRGEHAANWPARIAPRVHLQDGSVREMQPGDHDDVVAGMQAIERGPHVRVEYQPAVRRAFVTLAWGRLRLGQRRFNKR